MRNRVAIFVSCILLFITCEAQFQLPESEVNALSDMIDAWPALRTSVEGPWGDPKNDDPCNSFWDGLECRKGHVTVLSPNVNLAGSIPKSIGNLTDLEILNLRGKNVSGTIPSSFEALQNLLVVDLSFNTMIGAIPDFRNSSYLTDLILSNNALSGPIPNYALPLLENLLLANNSFSGDVPPFDLLFPEILSIDISNNLLSGSISSGLNSLRFIEKFDLSSNRLSGTIPAFGGDALVNIRLSRNQLSGPVPGWGPSVEELNLAENHLSICINPQKMTVPKCDISGQKIRSCGCKAKEFYNFCILDPIPPSCRARVPVAVIVLLSLALVALLILLVVMFKKRSINAQEAPQADIALSTISSAPHAGLGADSLNQSEEGTDSGGEGESDTTRLEW